MKIRFVHKDKSGNSVTFNIQKLPVTLGREADNNIALSDKSDFPQKRPAVYQGPWFS